MASDNANTIQWQTRDSLPNAPESDSDAVVGCPMPLGFPLHGFREHTCHKGAGPKFTILNSLFTIQKGRHVLPCVRHYFFFMTKVISRTSSATRSDTYWVAS